MKHPTLYRDKGFTLIELLVVIAIIGIAGGLLLLGIKVALKFVCVLLLVAAVVWVVAYLLNKKS